MNSNLLIADENLLIQIGDAMDATDDVREENGIGFNKIDKSRWPSVRGNATGMAQLLKKYHKQVENRFGADEANFLRNYEINFVFVPEFVDGKLIAKVTGIPKESFHSYVTLHKKFGFRFSYDTKTWQALCSELLAATTVEYLTSLLSLGFTSSISAEDFRAQILANIAVSNENTAAILAYNTVTVKSLDNGKFAFEFPFSAELNHVFSNKTGVLSGITEYNPRNHNRETLDIELVMEAIEKIRIAVPTWNVRIEQGVQDAYVARQEQMNALMRPIPEVAANLAAGIELFPYQNEMVRFLQKTDGNALVGDEMGLGKTLMTLSYAVSVGIKSILIVCPKVVRRTWIQEACKFFPSYFTADNTLELTPKLAKKDFHTFGRPRLVTVNYESLHKLMPFIEASKFELIVVDESHRIKNENTAAYNYVSEAAQFSKHKILLSGTAIKNKKSELFPQINLVKPGLFASKGELTESTIGAAWNKLQCAYMARQKQKILKFLPPKIHSVVALEVDEVKGIPLPTSFEEIAGIKAAIAIAKAPATASYLKEMLANSDSCALVFTDSVEAAKLIVEALGDDALLHHGQMTDDKREEVKLAFQSGTSRARIFVSTRQSLAVGATLTRADQVVFNDFAWTIADMAQAEDRAHRIGQIKNVQVHWIVADNHQWDRYIARILARKMDLCKKMNQGKQLTSEEKAFMNDAVNPKEFLKQVA